MDLLDLKSNGQNIDVFMLAFSLGVKEGIRTPSQHKEGFILESSLKGDNEAFIYAVALNDLLKTGEESKITDTDIFYLIAEEYANTGFGILNDLICNKHYDEETLVYDLIERMDDVIESDD